VRYFDHHFPGAIPEHPGLDAHIETFPHKGTSLLVDDFLGGKCRAWAVVGTFGDMNYNAYGARLEDLYLAPDELFRRLRPYADPCAFIAADPAFRTLRAGYAEDTARARALKPELTDDRYALYILPAEPWARRASGLLANQLARTSAQRPHALLTRLPNGGFVVSVRAPMATGTGADALCRQFPTGGGRKAAAGIDYLPDDSYDEFVRQFIAAF